MVTRNAAAIKRLAPSQVECGDLVNAGHVALVAAAAKFDPRWGTTLAAYARLAVRGAMWDQVRRRNWVEMSHLELKVEFIEIADDRQSPEAMLEAAKKKKAATEAMGCLDGRERVVVSRYYGGEELVEIGREMGIGKKTMTKIHRRALGKMQEYFRLRGIKAA